MDEKLKALAMPFPAEFIEWRPGATNKDKTKAQALAYVDPRHYQDRLNEICGLRWSSLRDIQFTSEKVVITVTLYLGDVSRSGVGEASLTDKFGKALAVTKADAQAFKRACVEYGLGRYLYNWGRVWVAFDANTKRFTKTAISELGQKAYNMTQQTTKQWEGKKVEPGPKVEKLTSKPKKKVDPKPKKEKNSGSEEPNWSWFWTALKAKGYGPDDIHKLEGFTSVKQWLSDNPAKTLVDALNEIISRLKPEQKGFNDTVEELYGP